MDVDTLVYTVVAGVAVDTLASDEHAMSGSEASDVHTECVGVSSFLGLCGAIVAHIVTYGAGGEAPTWVV